MSLMDLVCICIFYILFYLVCVSVCECGGGGNLSNMGNKKQN